MHLGIFRLFVWAIDASEVLQLPGARLLIEPLHVALFRFGERRIHEHLIEFAIRHQTTRHVALGAEWRDEGDEDDKSGVRHELRDLGHAADVLDAIGVGEAKVAIETVAHVIAIEQYRMLAERVQLLVDQVRDRGFARAGEASEPEHRRLLAFDLRARRARHL